jgi:ubiquinone biosynthesis protein Coq4
MEELTTARQGGNMDDIPYLLRGITQLSTASSTLISSSQYLNNPQLRDWVAQELLRKNGPDLPTPSGAFRLSGIIKAMQNYAEIDAMLEDERKRVPALDRFFSERHVSTYTLEDLAKYPPGSVAGLFYKQIADGGYQVNIVPPWEAKGNYDYWLLRSGQTHDLEHIITAGGFDSLGEVVVGLAKLENIYKHFSPELACELNVMQFFASFRFISRMALHYPQVWHDMWAAVDRGRKVGMASDLYINAKYEDVFHLTPAEAREALGVRAVEEVDTTMPSRIWDGKA